MKKIKCIVCSHSFEAKPSAVVDLLPSGESDHNGLFAPVATSDGSEQLLQLLARQQKILMELKDEQQQKFAALQNQLVLLRTSVLEEQKVGFAEMKIEHRILHLLLYALHILVYLCQASNSFT